MTSCGRARIVFGGREMVRERREAMCDTCGCRDKKKKETPKKK